MSSQLTNSNPSVQLYRADCANCFGLCCVALPYAKSADFTLDKEGGTPCQNLQADYRCGIHQHLRNKGFRGCAVYECFGAGQKVSQTTYEGKDWRKNSEAKEEMFAVFPIMQQLHEMLAYLQEALSLEETETIHKDIEEVLKKTEALTALKPAEILDLNVPMIRAQVNELLLQTSEFVRSKVISKRRKLGRGTDLLGAKLKGADLRGYNLRGALLIAADLRNADIRYCDFIGADLRDANLAGANLIGSIFLTQAQVNSANGDINTKLPPSLERPAHWI